MASRPIFSMLGRKAAAGVAAGAAVTAGQPSASAREAVHASAAPAPATSRAHQQQQQVLDDDWLETSFDQEVVVFRSFRPEEVDQAVESIALAVGKQGKQGKRVVALRTPPLGIEEQGDSTTTTTTTATTSATEGTSGAAHAHAHASTQMATGGDPHSPASGAASSYGDAATDVLAEPLVAQHASEEQQGLGGVAGTVAGAAQQQAGGDVGDLLEITRRLLRRPGLQREVIKCMMEDVEVRDLMLRQSRNIDLYLQAAGVHQPAGLLTGPSGSGSGNGGVKGGMRLPRSVRPRVVGPDGNFVHEVEEEEEEEEGGKPELLHKILDAVAACIDQTGSWLAGLGGWLRCRFTDLGLLLGGAFGMVPSQHDQQLEQEDQEEEGREGREKGQGAGDVVMGAVMVVTVAVFCVLLARSPRLVVSSAVGLGAAAASAKRQQVAGAAGAAGGVA